MKKMKKLLVFVMGALLVTGCTIKAEVQTNITSDKNVTFSYITGFDRELAISLANFSQEDLSQKTNKEILEWMKGSDNADIDIEEFEKNGFTVTELAEDDLIGYKLTVNLGNLDNLVNNTEPFDLENIKDIKKMNIFTKLDKTYNLKFENKIDNSYDTYVESGLKVESNYVLTLPTKTKSNNATKVSEDGKTLTWDLTKVTSVEAEFELTTDFIGTVKELINKNMYLAIGIGAAVFIIIIILLLSISNKKSQKNPLENQKEKTLNPKSGLNMPDLMASDPAEAVQAQPAANMEIQTPVVEQTQEPVVAPVEQPIEEATPVMDSAPVVENVVPEEPTTVVLEPNLNSFVATEVETQEVPVEEAPVVDAFNQQPNGPETITEPIAPEAAPVVEPVVEAPVPEVTPVAEPVVEAPVLPEEPVMVPESQEVQSAPSEGETVTVPTSQETVTEPNLTETVPVPGADENNQI